MARNKTRCKVMLGKELMFPSRYLSAEDLDGQDHVVTIEKVVMSALQTNDGSTESKPVVSFVGKKKQLVLCKTSSGQIATATGESQAMKWPGKKITLFPTTCDCFGQTVTCVRVRDTAPKASAETKHDFDADGDEPPPKKSDEPFNSEKIVAAFKAIGSHPAQVEEAVGKPVSEWTAADKPFLGTLYSDWSAKYRKAQAELAAASV